MKDNAEIKKEVENRSKDFIKEIKRVYRDKAYMLRKCSSASNIHFFKTFPSFTYEFNKNNDRSFTYKIISSLFYYHSIDSSEDISLGQSCKKYFNRKEISSFENRFLKIINSDSRESIYKNRTLLKVIQLLNKEQIPINYEKLFIDLWYFGDSTRERWGYDFYSIE